MDPRMVIKIMTGKYDSPLLSWALFLSNERSQLEITKKGQT